MSATAMRIRTRSSLDLAPLCIARTLLFVCARNVSARAVQDDSGVYTTLNGWEDRPTCARCLLEADLGVCDARDVLSDAVSSTTNACPCWPNALGNLAEIIDETVVIPFTHHDDQTTATEDFVQCPSTHSYATFSAIALPKTTGSQSPLREIRETTRDSQSQPPFTSDLFPSLTIATSWSTTTAPLSYPITNNSNPANSVSFKTDSNDDRLKTSDIIGMVVQILGLLIAALTLFVSWKMGRPERLWQGVTVQYVVVPMRQV
ncbi:hypothetical protein E0Z10_g344 [Xylaria hypoxylon]|uniref:Uncharacterized protein n=1 Tax=Xylaria hypoxylon TaxID=37992 RepID=A0A4Z0YWX1_9PEZI|nr:hypothetical protein E0Z10_g344 [Xylaria hypoxylon]